MHLSRQAMLLLAKIPLFSRIDSKAMADLTNRLAERRLGRGSLLFQEGDAALSLFIVRSGLLKVVKHGSDDRDIALRVTLPGALLGEVAVFDGSPYPASAEALEDSVVFELSRPNLLIFLQRNPDAALAIMAVLSERLRDAYSVLSGMATNRIEQRVGMMLLKLADATPHSDPDEPLSIPLTRQDIAEMVGCSKESVSRTMGRMKRLGIVARSRGRIAIASPPKLRRFCAKLHPG